MNIEELVVKHASWIRRKARHFYTDKNEADDLASETIYNCLKNAHRYNPKLSFKPWVVAIMSNIYITWYNRRRCVLFTGLEKQDTFRESDRTDQRAAIDRIMSVVWECSHKSCCIECVMLYAEGYSIKEIAERLDIPVGTVKSRISAGRKMLRDELEI